MRKHVYVDPGCKPMPDLMPNWVGYTCVHCGHRSGLDAWQLKDMPREKAMCLKSPKCAGFFEWLADSINCLLLNRRAP